jgi:DNA polymerase-3 subunit beta
MLVPVRTLVELQRLLGASGQGAGEEGQVVLRPGEVDATFEVGTGVVTTRLVGAEFPDTSQLFPASYPNRLVVGREAFLDALRRVRLLVANERSPVRMALGGDGIQLTASDEERGQASEDVDAKYEGTELTVAFNPAYLIEGVDAVIGDEVLMEVVDATKPATLRGASTDPYRYLIMPVRVP